MKPWHVVAAIAVAGAAVGFFAFGRAASNTTRSVASAAVTIPAQAAATAAESNVQQALPALSAYYAAEGTYAGASAASLAGYGGGLSPTLVVVGASATGFCVEDTVDGATASASSTSGPVVAAACP